MKLAKFEKEIRETLNEAVMNAIREEENEVYVVVDTNDGYIDILLSRKGNMNVIINHDNENNYTMPNLSAWIENIAREYNGIINWLEVELESLDDIDTSDEAEYWNPGITRKVCNRAKEIRRQIEALKQKV